MPLFAGIQKMRAQNQLRLERLKAGRFFDVTCERGHISQMSGVDLCRRLDLYGEKMLCPECYEKVRVSSIADGPLMNDEQKKKQQDEYLVWSQEKERERKRKQQARMTELAAMGY